MSLLNWTALIGVGLDLYLSRRAAKLADTRFWHRQTASLQLQQLRGLLSAAANTQFGRQHGFARLNELSDDQVLPAFRAAIPAGDIERFRPAIGEMRDHARPDVLWPGKVMHFAQTSGTTAGDKFIPVSDAMMKSNYRAALDIFAHNRVMGLSAARLTAGKCLFLGGSTALATNAHGVRTGDLSGLVVPLIRWPISAVYLPGKKTALLSEWKAKIDAMAHQAIDQDVRMINGMPSWMLVLFERLFQLRAEQGRPVKTLREIWPNLTLLVHGGVKYAPFEPRVRQFWSGSPAGDDVPNRFELYPASEGFIAMSDRRGHAGMRLCSDIGNFYEFIPLEEVHKPDAPAFEVDRVDKGQKYVVCMSTCAGLWRYIIGDVVEFDSIPAHLDGRGGDGPARLRIVGRHKHFINAFGENLIGEHIENAVARAAASTGLVVGEFTAAPIYPGRPLPTGEVTRAALELAVELDGQTPPQDHDLARFRDEFDAALKAQNVDYTTKRTDGLGMVEPKITPLPRGTFHRWMASRGKLGGQHKCPRCANHRDIIDAVVALRAS